MPGKATSRSLIILFVVLLLIVVSVSFWLTHRSKNSQEIIGPMLSVSAFNQTQNINAIYGSVHPQDVIVYTLTAENKTDEPILGYVTEVNISDVANISTLLDAQGAGYNLATNSLVWTPQDIQANGLIQKQFSVRVNPVPPGTAGAVLKVAFNNQLNIAVSSSKVAGIIAGGQLAPQPSGQVYGAPVTGTGLNLAFILAFLTTIGTFLARRNTKTIKIRP